MSEQELKSLSVSDLHALAQEIRIELEYSNLDTKQEKEFREKLILITEEIFNRI